MAISRANAFVTFFTVLSICVNVGQPQTSYAADFIRHRDKTLIASEFPSQPASGLHWRSRFALEECLRECAENRVRDPAGCQAVAFDKRRGQGCWLLPRDFRHYDGKKALSRNPRFDFYDKKSVTSNRRRPPTSSIEVVEGFLRKPNLGTYDADGESHPRWTLEECGHSCEETGTLNGKDCYAFQFNHGRGEGCYLFTEEEYKGSAFTRSNEYHVYEKQGGGTPGENVSPPFVSRCEFDRYQQMHIKKSAFPSRPAEGRHWRDDLTIDECKRACEEGNPISNCGLIAFNSLLKRGCWLLEHNYNYFQSRESVQPNHHYELYDMKCDPTRGGGGTPKGEGGAPENAEEEEEEEEIVNGCKYKLHPNHAIFPFPSLAKDAIHWQQGMSIAECKGSCREGTPVAGCNSIVYYKKDNTQGCWLLTEDKQTYEKRREYYEFFDYDFYQLICEDSQGVNTKAGVCPSASDVGGSCTDECSVDTDCFGTRKCCSNGCGKTCVSPATADSREEDECKFTEYKNQWIYRPEHGGNQTGLTLEQCKMACKMNTFFDNCRAFVFKNPPNGETGCYFMPNPVGFYGRLNQGNYVTTIDVDCKKDRTAKSVPTTARTSLAPTTVANRFSAVSPKCSFTTHSRMAPKPDAFPSRMEEKVHWREGLNVEECKALCSHRHVVLNCRSVAMSKDPSRPGCWLLPHSFIQLEKMNKLAPNLFYEMLDMKCKVEDCTFTVRRNRALAGYNSKRIFANSPNDCKQMCIEEEEFECLSFEWWKNSKDCSLSSDSVDTVPQTLFQHNENSDYFHRSCGFDPAPTQPLDICAEAIETLGVNSGRVKDDQFSASSLEIARKTAPHCARVINLNEECHGGYGWCPRVGDSDPWLQLDLGSRRKVIGVMLYSGGDVHRRVPKFSVRTSEDGREWNYFLDGYGNKMEFKGFTDASIVGPVTITFPRHLHARHFRLYPLRGDDRQLENVCLRIELLTC